MNRFKIYPSKKNSKLYFEVVVSNSRKEMYEYYEILEDKISGFNRLDDNEWDRAEHNFDGMCFPYQHYNKKMIMDNKIGEILLFKNRLSNRVISHECTHSGLFYVQVLKDVDNNVKNIFDNDADTEQEEVVCYAVGDMTQQIVNKCYKLGYYA